MRKLFRARGMVFAVISAGVLITVCFAYINYINNEQTQMHTDQENIYPGAIQLTSPDFSHNGTYPRQFTCDRENIVPPLNIGGIPDRAKSLAIVLRDPDAPSGIFVHWIVFNIDPATEEIQMGTVPHGAVQGRTTDGKNHYVGPCPPSGTHRYIFTLYALDKKLDLPEGVAIEKFNAAISGHVIDKTVLMALYR